jgi:hypothetical protein
MCAQMNFPSRILYFSHKISYKPRESQKYANIDIKALSFKGIQISTEMLIRKDNHEYKKEV